MLFERIKKLLRITGTMHDDIIKMNIESAFADMKDQKIDISSDRIKIEKAVELYCKWQMNYNGEADRFEKNYLALRDQMSMQDDYKVNSNEG